MGGYGQQRGAVRRVIAGAILGFVGAATASAGTWAATPAVGHEAVAATAVQQAVAAPSGPSSHTAPIRAVGFSMWRMGTVTRAARIDFVGDPRAVIYPGYYPNGTVIGPDKTPQPEVFIDPTGKGDIWYNYDAPVGYQAFTQSVDGIASGSFGLFMDIGEDLLDNFTASIVGVSSADDGLSTVNLHGDLPYWYGNRIEVVSDGAVIAAQDFADTLWALDVPNVSPGEHNWEVRLVYEGQIIMVRDVTVIAGDLSAPLVSPIGLAATGVGGLVAIGSTAAIRRRHVAAQ